MIDSESLHTIILWEHCVCINCQTTSSDACRDR